MARILIFGDSIAYGFWGIKGGWADYLKSLYMEKNIIDSDTYFEIYNLAIDGDDTKNLLKRFEFEIKQRIWGSEEVSIILAIGINDSCFVKSKNTFLVAENNFKKNIQKLIEISNKYTSKIIFVGLTPVEEIKTNPIPWSTTGESYKNEYIRKYDSIIKSVCQENKVYFIDMFSKFNKLDYKKLLEDGLHPNSEGHRKMFEIVRDFLTKEGIVK